MSSAVEAKVPTRKKERVASWVVRALAEAGVTAVFGVPGGAVGALHDALLDEPRIRVINNSHETMAVFAAAAHARATGQLGVVVTTSGPGVTNAVTGMASALLDGLPVLLIAGEVARSKFGQGVLQEGSSYFLSVVSMMRHVTKFAAEVASPQTAMPTVLKAMRTATSGRKGPVFVTIPIDIQGAQTSSPSLSANVESSFSVRPEVVEAALGQLVDARRPLIFAGSGMREGRSPELLKKLAERLQIPVATTPKAKGVFPESHPLALGVYGYGAHRSAGEYIREGVDVLLALGTSLGDMATNGWDPSLTPSRTLIQVDIDGANLGRNFEVDIAIVARGEDVLSMMLSQAPQLSRLATTAGITHHPVHAKVAGGLTTAQALEELNALIPHNAVVACDVGEHTLMALHFLKVDDPNGFFLFSGLSSMGASLGAATGLRVAHPHRPVVAICGDGSMWMSGNEIATASMNHLDCLFFVINDGGYRIVENGQKAIYGRTSSYPVRLDIPSLAKGLGAQVSVFERPGDLRRLLSTPASGQGPRIVDVRVVADTGLPRTSRFEQLRAAVLSVQGEAVPKPNSPRPTA